MPREHIGRAHKEGLPQEVMSKLSPKDEYKLVKVKRDLQRKSEEAA